jgi:hypothetical protein
MFVRPWTAVFTCESFNSHDLVCHYSGSADHAEVVSCGVILSYILFPPMEPDGFSIFGDDMDFE